MKHPYRVDCACQRCTRERTRRTQQSHTDTAQDPYRHTMHHTIRRGNSIARKGSRRPTPGTQEWAETRGDDIDSESGDY